MQNGVIITEMVDIAQTPYDDVSHYYKYSVFLHDDQGFESHSDNGNNGYTIGDLVAIASSNKPEDRWLDFSSIVKLVPCDLTNDGWIVFKNAFFEHAPEVCCDSPAWSPAAMGKYFDDWFVYGASPFEMGKIWAENYRKIDSVCNHPQM